MMHQFNDQEELAQIIAQCIKDNFSELNKPGVTIADVGCGNGIVTHYVADLFWHARVVGTDIDESLIKTVSASSDNSRFISMNTLLERSEQFDFVYSCFVLHHVVPSSQGVFLSTMMNLLKKSGVCMIIELNPFHLPTYVSFIFNSYEKNVRMVFPQKLSTLAQHVLVTRPTFRLPNQRNTIFDWITRSFYAGIFVK